MIKPEYNELVNITLTPGRFGISKRLLLQKIKNTFLTPRFLYNLLIREKHYAQIINGITNKWNKIFHKFWFFPRIIDYHLLRDGLNQVDYIHDFKHYSTLNEVTEKFISYVDYYCSGHKNFRILDLGCNCGRFLKYMYNQGYTDLHGIDFSKEALNHFEFNNPDAIKSVTLYQDFFQRFLIKSQTKSYDCIYSYGSTIEDVHPSFDIIKHICRITSKYVIIQIVEHKQYTRFYQLEFERNGFYLVRAIRSAAQDVVGDEQQQMSILIFQSYNYRWQN